MKITIRNGEEVFEKELWLTKPIERYELLTVIRNLYQPSKNFTSDHFKFIGDAGMNITDTDEVIVDVDSLTIFMKESE